MVSSQLQEWINHARAELARSPKFFISAHTDEISGGGVLSRVELLDLLSTVTRMLPSLRARLALPYGYSSCIDTTLPNLAIPNVDTSDEPPSLYLFADGFLSLATDREEYRCPYPRTPWGDSFAAEYVCSRSIQERTLGWEFSRTVWVRRAESSQRPTTRRDGDAA